jgi:phytoene dehydrogenase-like protein
MLGATLAETACHRGPYHVPGEIRGASFEVGHLLREPPKLEDAKEVHEVPVVIVGGGPSGLAAAWRLKRLGHEGVVVLDLEPREGGTSLYGTDGVVTYPWGAHYVPVPRRENVSLLAVLREMGAITGEDDRGRPVLAEEVVVREPEERLFLDGKWHEGLYPRAGASPADLRDLAAFQALIDEFTLFRDGQGRRAFDIPMERSTDDPSITALDRISMTDWLRQKNLTSTRLGWLVDYACKDDYGLRAADTSAWAGLFYFASRVEKPGAEAADLFAWTNGNGRFVQHFSSVVGEQIKTNHLVIDIVEQPEATPGAGTFVDVLAMRFPDKTLVRYRAKRVICATPKFLTTRIVRPLRETKPAHLAAFQYGAWMVANLHLSAHPTSEGAPLAWDNVLYKSPSLGYVVATHQDHVDLGPTVLTYYYPYTDSDPRKGRERLYAEGHGAITDAIMSDLVPAHQHFEKLVSRVDVTRWGHAMTQPRVGFVWSGARQKATLPVGKIHMAHSDLSGLALFEESLHHGVRAAEEVFDALYPDKLADVARLGKA